MGWFNAILNSKNPEGVRESIRMSYRDFAKRWALNPRPDGTSLHALALWGASDARWKAQGVVLPQTQVWTELAPFLLIEDEREAVEVLAEYVVFREQPEAARTEWLGRQISNAVSLALLRDENAQAGVVAGFMGRSAWCVLLNDDAYASLKWMAERLAAN
jgi:hypothetical protein